MKFRTLSDYVAKMWEGMFLAPRIRMPSFGANEYCSKVLWYSTVGFGLEQPSMVLSFKKGNSLEISKALAVIWLSGDGDALQ